MPLFFEVLLLTTGIRFFIRKFIFLSRFDKISLELKKSKAKAAFRTPWTWLLFLTIRVICVHAFSVVSCLHIFNYKSSNFCSIDFAYKSHYFFTTLTQSGFQHIPGTEILTFGQDSGYFRINSSLSTNRYINIPIEPLMSSTVLKIFELWGEKTSAKHFRPVKIWILDTRMPRFCNWCVCLISEQSNQLLWGNNKWS